MGIPVSVANPPGGTTLPPPMCPSTYRPRPDTESTDPSGPGDGRGGTPPAMPWDHSGKHHLTLPGRCKTGEAPHESALHWGHPANPRALNPDSWTEGDVQCPEKMSPRTDNNNKIGLGHLWAQGQ